MRMQDITRGMRLQRVSQRDLGPDERPWGVPGRFVGGEVEMIWNRWPDASLVTWEEPSGLEPWIR